MLFAATGGMVLMEVVMVNKATRKFTQQMLILEFVLSSVLGALIALQISRLGNTTRVLNSSSHVVTM